MIFRWLDQPPVKILLLLSTSRSLFSMVSDNDNGDNSYYIHSNVGYSLDAF